MAVAGQTAASINRPCTGQPCLSTTHLSYHGIVAVRQNICQIDQTDSQATRQEGQGTSERKDGMRQLRFVRGPNLFTFTLYAKHQDTYIQFSSVGLARRPDPVSWYQNDGGDAGAKITCTYTRTSLMAHRLPVLARTVADHRTYCNE